MTADRTTSMGPMGTPPNTSTDEKAKANLATEDMAINAKGEKVSPTDPSAVTLIAAKGQPIPSDEHIKAMGFKTADERAPDAQTETAAKADAKAEDKAAPKAEDKAAGRKSTKAK